MKKSQLQKIIKGEIKSLLKEGFESGGRDEWEARFGKDKPYPPDTEEHQSKLYNNTELNGLVDDLQIGIRNNDWNRAKLSSEKIDRILNEWKLDQI